MSETTLQLEAAVNAPASLDAPLLLVQWTPRWQDFVTSIRPALARSAARLAGEAPYGLVPYRGMLTTWVTEAFLLFVAIAFPLKLAQMRRYVPPKLPTHDVIYYTGNELPRTQDLGGAQSGVSGRAGGRESHHPTQTIRIARGGSLVEKVVDVHGLKIPASYNRDAVANLLAIRPNAGPPPVEGVRSSRPPLTLPSDVLAPLPDVTRTSIRNLHSLDSVVPPAPSVSQSRALAVPMASPGVVAPAPDVARLNARPAPAQAQVIPPAPAAASKEISRSPVLAMSQALPPPVSAPERQSTRDRKLTLPPPSVVAPPPSAEVSSDLRRLASGSVQDTSVVPPPPPTQSSSGSLVGNLIGRLFGTTDVVAPPAVTGGGPSSPRSSGAPSTSAVVPPPSTAPAAASAPRGVPGALNSAVVAPPPLSGSSTGKSGSSNVAGRTSLSASNVIPPPPTAEANRRSGDLDRAGLASDGIIPPPPSISGAAASSGSGRGAKNSGTGGSLEVGAPLAPPTNGGSGGTSAVVVSNQPGSRIAVPNASPGSLAMSPRGSEKPGLGGSGGGTSIGTGPGPGSGLTGEHSGAAKTGTGRGSDSKASNGISTAPGPGGAGNERSGTPPVPGVSIEGGSTIVTVDIAGSSVGAADPSLPARSSVRGPSSSFTVSVESTATSGGAFDFYHQLSGDQHSLYLDTSVPTVMQFADPESATRTFSAPLVDPQPIRIDLPASLPRSRLVIACTLDASGNLRNLHVVETGPADMTSKVMAALPSWKFRPARRGERPIAVTAILGFNIDTNDR